MDTSEGGDYKTGQKVLDEDETLEEDEETEVEPSRVAQSVDFREKTSDKEYTLREKKKNPNSTK